MRAIARGESVLHPTIARLVIDAAVQGNAPTESASDHLTEREREVLALIGEGKTNSEIAQSLGISQKTVDKHRASLMQKLGITTRAGLIRYALGKD